MSRITIDETSPSGEVLNTYVMTQSGGIETTGSSRNSPSSTGRIDVVPPDPLKPAASSFPPPTTVFRRLLEPFLPVGYPDSVSPDYTPYQIYDSLQALFSTTASLLASRAVLTTLGVGSSDATTSFAMYLSIAQSTLSNVTSILFAHRFSTAIAGHVKFFRFFADIVNDSAFVLDVLSPSLPPWGRVPALCAASCCRAVCGVAGGASKAILSGHFAKGGNVGELAAKDGSQEVLVNLVGMWIGGFVVGRIEGPLVTWGVLLVLLAGHLWANWAAVSSVRLRTLEGGRMAMVGARLMEGSGVSVEEVGREESILLDVAQTGRKNMPLRLRGKVVGTCCFGGVRGLLACAGWSSQAGDRAYVGDAPSLRSLIEIFQEENYLLWWDWKARRCVVLLKGGGDVAAQLKAMCHAFRICGTVGHDTERKTALDIIRETLVINRAEWSRLSTAVRVGGWKFETSDSMAGSGTRFEVRPSK
ncbi:uncharacterized protein HMPREF1541_07648 [Cyphellophora europaea CBS 101466]|uniref:Protein root UVB sensitive/RUS domain-containing protein n=1 Tax=Cyphellophora europaea (strain CBS 101466) TaxID=1220924 RepID=W2RNX2_CYPE1|nr:uncharacterized protein HMPREF1541_07648 [Cyphellophora europaea CBS 101466]ETN38025.1 hypothetical protein HMPREF1541_07648 [Cyphellophora europaea CBS 101466]